MSQHVWGLPSAKCSPGQIFTDISFLVYSFPLGNVMASDGLDSLPLQTHPGLSNKRLALDFLEAFPGWGKAEDSPGCCRHHEEWGRPWGQLVTKSTSVHVEQCHPENTGLHLQQGGFRGSNRDGLGLVVGMLSDAHLWLSWLLPHFVLRLLSSDTSDRRMILITRIVSYLALHLSASPLWAPWAQTIFRSISGSTLHIPIGQFVIYSLKLDKIQPSLYRLRQILL